MLAMDDELQIVLAKLVNREPILPNLRLCNSPQKKSFKDIHPQPGSSKNSVDYIKTECESEIPQEPREPPRKKSKYNSSEIFEKKVSSRKNTKKPVSEDSDADSSEENEVEDAIKKEPEDSDDDFDEFRKEDEVPVKQEPEDSDSDFEVDLKQEPEDSDDDFDEFENGVVVPSRRKRKPPPSKNSDDNDFSEEEVGVKVRQKKKTKRYRNLSQDKKPRRPSFLSPVSENGSACKYNGMRSKQLRLLLRSDNVIQFCQENGLISKTVTCSCGNPMKLGNKRSSDGCGWICYERCHEIRPDQTIRKGTWFECSKLGISDILWIAYMWVYEYSCMSMLHECDHSNRTVIGWCTCCQGFCKEIIKFKKEPIGGEGRTVEIFKRQVKDEAHWTLCAIEHDSTNTLHIIVDDDNTVTLMKIFNQYFLPKTKVVAKNWSFMKDLSSEDFLYLTMEKCISFYDQVRKDVVKDFETFKTRTCRAHVQDEWSNIKHEPSFYEKMYRKSLSFSSDAFLTFLKDITLIYKPLATLLDSK